MLSLPAHSTVNRVTIYQDDAVWNRFYLLASTPTIRRDENDRPVFLLATYTFTEQDRLADPSLPIGGGYLNFDTELKVDAATQDTIVAGLQTWVDAEHRRRNPSTTDDPPAVEVADPLLSGGTVTMIAPQSAALISSRFAEAPASLASGSTAVFSCDLTAAGSGFMHDLLVNPDGSGQIDLTPIQVQYQMLMWARLPPVIITVIGESERIHKMMQEISESNRDDPCTAAEIETYRETGTNSSSLVETGMVDVKIDVGNANLPEDAIQALQDYALGLFDTMVQERFLVPADAEDDSLEFDSGDPDLQDTDPGWAAVLYQHADFRGESLELTDSAGSLGSLNNHVSAVKVRRGARVTLYSERNYRGKAKQYSNSTGYVGSAFNDKADSAKVWFPPTTRYKTRETVNHSTMNLEIRLERSSVVEWPVGGMATLETFFAGLPPEELSRHVVNVRADMLQTLGVTIRPFVDFDTGIGAVEVQMEYFTIDEDGQEMVVAQNSFTFDAESAAATFDPALVGDRRDYRFRHRVIYDSGESSEFTDWTVDSSRSLNVAVQDPGLIELEVSAAALNFNIIDSVVVELSYQDAGATDPELAHTMQLRPADTTVGVWKHSFNKALTGQVSAQVVYRLTDGKVIERQAEMVDPTLNLFLVPPPQVDILNVSFVPSGDWTDVAQVIVAGRYDAGNGQVFDGHWRFTSVDQFETWEILLDDPNRRDFSYQITATYTTAAAPHQTPWIDATGDQTVVVEAFAPPRLTVHTHATLIDFERTPAVTVAFAYGAARQTISMTAGSVGTFSAPIPANGTREYEYVVTYFTAAGDPLVMDPVVSSETELFVPRANLPTTGKLIVEVRGRAIDFAATPFVDVELLWSDGEVQERHHASLSAQSTSSQWELDIGDRSIRTYSYEVTYTLASGVTAPGMSGVSDDPFLSIMAFEPTTDPA